MLRRPENRREEVPGDPILLPRINMPPWLKSEFEFLFLDKDADKKVHFFDRVAEIHLPDTRRYKRIKRAYETAEKEFCGKLRDDGEDYFDHLVESALIAIVHVHITDADVICAILLHDIIEDVKGWSWRRVKREFNDNIARMVRRNTKSPYGKNCRYKTEKERDQAYREQVWNADRDSVIVKLCERLHNTIKMWRTGEKRIRRKLRETEVWILRLAHREQILAFEYKSILSFIREKLEN